MLVDSLTDDQAGGALAATPGLPLSADPGGGPFDRSYPRRCEAKIIRPSMDRRMRDQFRHRRQRESDIELGPLEHQHAKSPVSPHAQSQIHRRRGSPVRLIRVAAHDRDGCRSSTCADPSHARTVFVSRAVLRHPRPGRTACLDVGLSSLDSCAKCPGSRLGKVREDSPWQGTPGSAPGNAGRRPSGSGPKAQNVDGRSTSVDGARVPSTPSSSTT